MSDPMHYHMHGPERLDTAAKNGLLDNPGPWVLDPRNHYTASPCTICYRRHLDLVTLFHSEMSDQ